MIVNSICVDMEGKSLSFINRNLEVFGFGNDEEALRTSFIEVLDNSMDAILNNSSVSTNEKEIVIKIIKVSDREYALEITDNGIGMCGKDIPDLCCGVFQTSKRESQLQYVGKFGVGLKGILLYYNAVLTVSSSNQSEKEITSYKVLLDCYYSSS